MLSGYCNIHLGIRNCSVQYSMEKYNSCYPAYLVNVKSNPTGIFNISSLSEYLLMVSKKWGA